ncbi:MAG: ABC transporter permease [Nitrososphaerales archaeon]|nr:ABC transporter permease [Nitrososphaerales archaeon]
MKAWSRSSLRADAGDGFKFLHTMKVLSKDKLFVFGLVFVLAMALAAALAPWITPYPLQGIGYAAEPAPQCPGLPTAIAGVCPPTASNVFGTEQLGRDLLTRIVFGMRTSLLIGVYTVALATTIGLTVGLSAAFFGGWVDEALMRMTDVFLSFPHLILALVIVATLGPSFTSVFVALGVTWWPAFARLARGKALSVKTQNFVLAAKAAGASNRSIIVRHILPNSLAPLTVQMSLDMGIAILAEAGLSFLGLGIRPPAADLGVLIFESGNFLTTAWWLALFPGFFLFMLVLSFNLIGDRINTYLDPRLSRGRML